MKINSTYSIDFHSKDLNKKKYNLLRNKALIIRDFKNKLSTDISSDIFYYLTKSKFDLIKQFNVKIKELSGQDIQHAISDVFITYSNKLNQIQNKMIFKCQKTIKKLYYKKNTKNNKKGDIKDFEIEFKSTNLCKCLNFLTKYKPNEEFLRNKKEFKSNNHEKIYTNILHFIDKFRIW